MISVTKLYDQLGGKMGKETAENLVTFIDDKIEKVVESKLDILESKLDGKFSSMESKFSTLESKFSTLETRFSTLETKLDSLAKNMATKADLATLEVKISDSKGELIKWSFLFWIGQAAVTIGIIMLFIKK